MKTKDKIEELEKRIRELEARPVFVPVYQPIYVQPAAPYPHPYIPHWYPAHWGQTICGTGVGIAPQCGTLEANSFGTTAGIPVGYLS